MGRHVVEISDSQDDVDVKVKRPRGRPRKPESEKKIKVAKYGKRGRPPKPKNEEVVNRVKLPRGRPKGSLNVKKIKRSIGRPRKIESSNNTPHKKVIKPIGRPRKPGSIKLNIVRRSLKFADGPKRGRGRPKKSEYNKRGRPKKTPEKTEDEDAAPTRDSGASSTQSDLLTPMVVLFPDKGSRRSAKLSATAQKRKLLNSVEIDDDVDIENTSEMVRTTPFRKSPKRQRNVDDEAQESAAVKKMKKPRPKSKQY